MLSRSVHAEASQPSCSIHGAAWRQPRCWRWRATVRDTDMATGTVFASPSDTLLPWQPSKRPLADQRGTVARAARILRIGHWLSLPSLPAPFPGSALEVREWGVWGMGGAKRVLRDHAPPHADACTLRRSGAAASSSTPHGPAPHTPSGPPRPACPPRPDRPARASLARTARVGHGVRG